jgi:hypothetical protein
MSSPKLHLLALSLALPLAACASARPAESSRAAMTPVDAPAAIDVETQPSGDGATNDCAACESEMLTPEVAQAIERRIGQLERRGGECALVGSALERSYREGRIRIRPFMWRVGERLISGEARPNGDIALAREIDSLNVGRRTLGEMLETMEHEAAHIAFAITGANGGEARAEAYVRACREAAALGAKQLELRR